MSAERWEREMPTSFLSSVCEVLQRQSARPMFRWSMAALAVLAAFLLILFFCTSVRQLVLGLKGMPAMKISVHELRGLEEIDVAEFETALRDADSARLATWYQAAVKTIDPASVTHETELPFLKSLLHNGVPAVLASSAGTQARAYATAAIQTQIALRSQLSATPTSQNISTLRKRIYLLQFIAYESLVLMSRLDQDTPKLIVISSAHLTPDELTRSGEVLEMPVLPGDVIIQLSAHALSSEFIAHSQTDPGLASHSALVAEVLRDKVTKKESDSTNSSNQARVIKMEALIEDGVNLREMKPTVTLDETAQMWILSLKTPSLRMQAGRATDAFAKLHRLPLVGPGLGEQDSPLKYDATMNPKMAEQGAYYCTTLLEEIYREAGVGDRRIPFRPDESNWANVKGLEAEIYRTLSITREKIAAPSDVFVNDEFELRATALNIAALSEARRLHAVVDGIFAVLERGTQLKESLLHQLIGLPDISLDKQKTLAILDRTLTIANDKHLISTSELEKVRAIRTKIYEALPQHATLRQVVFFFYLNNILQARMLTRLAQFEAIQPNQFATALDLRQHVAEVLPDELTRASAVLKIVNTLVPGGRSEIK